MDWDLKTLASLIESVAKLAWPLLALYVLWLFYPAVARVIESRGFRVKVGEMEVSVQDVSDQLATQVSDLQKKVEELRARLEAAPVQAAPPASRVQPFAPVPRRILWVDDKPSNVAFQVARLRAEGIEVVEAKSTAEALGVAASQALGLVITDMGRLENGEFHVRAGIELIAELRKQGSRLPVYVFSSARYLERYREEVLRSDGNGATSSPVELFEMIHRVIGPAPQA